jgi:hypothetical protein
MNKNFWPLSDLPRYSDVSSPINYNDSVFGFTQQILSDDSYILYRQHRAYNKMFMLGKISLTLLLLVGVCLAAGPYNETTDFWAKQLGRNLSYNSYAGIPSVII